MKIRRSQQPLLYHQPVPGSIVCFEQHGTLENVLEFSCSPTFIHNRQRTEPFVHCNFAFHVTCSRLYIYFNPSASWSMVSYSWATPPTKHSPGLKHVHMVKTEYFTMPMMAALKKAGIRLELDCVDWNLGQQPLLTMVGPVRCRNAKELLDRLAYTKAVHFPGLEKVHMLKKGSHLLTRT